MTSKQPGQSLWIIIVILALIIGGIIYFNTGREGGSETELLPPEEGLTETGAPSNIAISEELSPLVKSFELTAEDFVFSKTELRVKKGERVRIKLTGAEGMHDLTLDEFAVQTKRLEIGESDTVEFTADQTGTFEYYCSVGNHRQLGMVGALIVEAPAG